MRVRDALFELPWDDREALLAELRRNEARRPLVDAFEAAGASRPVELTSEQKADLFSAITAWGSRAITAWGSRVPVDEIPAGVILLRREVFAELDDLEKRGTQ